MEISNNIPKKFIRSKIINPFHGGIALGAIYAMDDLNSSETAVLIYIGSQTDFRHDGHSSPNISKKSISAATKLSRATITRVIISLVEKNYIYLENNFDENGYKIENTYYLTDYLFSRYVEMKRVKLGRAHHEPTEGSPRACYNTSVATEPLIEVVDSMEVTFDCVPEKKKNEGTETARNGHSPSPRQEDARDLDNSFVPVKEERTKPVVTAAHNKMVLLFTPRPELKSYVHRNTILALTDELISKHGKMAVKAINRLYDDLIAEDLCGKFEWSIKRTLSFFNEALKKIE